LVAAEIRAALAAGHTLRLVFEQHEAKLSFGYIQFTRYVKRFITMADSVALPRPVVGSTHAVPKQTFPLASSSASEPRQARPDLPRRFHFDPMSVDRKDLV
jgi:hypothetical protein